ncbi:NAD-dependent succinate-semialdehyde dehydrogenase [Sphingomonas colocasiae]|uniref:NAD-dependent succinate-semialdehyde dehydrogenase n=1 Tax=Sphingomonas colocasiae TaxID=1848973 RepID=A0ABS7PK46_9SPHN|nr:NAD-dependent succinate-semialdehyde dehydrogenase [Sphingomonas colocasiae]MBY8821665.1 NAD-dependent succinate-semialdehyde dehydrogenase [Sphingomonas colocasiae]
MGRELLKPLGFIDGRWVPADDGGTIAVDDPATGETIARVPWMGAGETHRAIDAAHRAGPDWAARTAGERARILRRWHDLMLEEQEALATLLTREQGKPLREARAEILHATAFLEWFAEEARRAHGEVIPAHAADRRLLVLRQPIGVVGAITPWNFPSAMVTRKVAPALAAGCTIILKPAEQTPLSALALATLGEEAGVPPGVFNIVTGDAPAIGSVLTTSPVVRKLSFTGSTATGRLLMRQSAETVKKLSLELGGNAPFLVFDDADLDAAVEGAMLSKFRNAGQTCVCTNRFHVQSGIHDAFVDRFAARIRGLRLGHGLDPASDIGPLIDASAVAKVEAHVADALAKGAELVVGGRRGAFDGGYEPTLLTQVRADMLVNHEETFGPLAAVIRFETEDQAIALANDSIFGLAGYLYTSDLARAWRVAEAIETGMVGINTGLISTEVAPFGGIKQSGLGREGGRQGLEEYQELKYLCIAA